VHTQGEPKGVKVQGGLLEIVTRSVEIECLPDEIPASFRVDVTELLIGQSKRAGDLGISGSMKLVSPADQVIAHIVSLRAEETTTTTDAAAPAAAEPDVVKKGKKVEEAAED
jgi:large subunit ribosomal protein L25